MFLRTQTRLSIGRIDHNTYKTKVANIRLVWGYGGVGFMLSTCPCRHYVVILHMVLMRVALVLICLYVRVVFFVLSVVRIQAYSDIGTNLRIKTVKA